MDTRQLNSDTDDQDPPPLIHDVFLQYLTVEEEEQISRQFRSCTWHRNFQVLWTGIPVAKAQQWADERELQTLTTAMGPLKMPENSICLKKKKSPSQWSKYIKGASAVFAWHISKGEKITVLTPPPPELFHPSGQTSYQAIEEPILKGKLGGCSVSRIELVHPTVKGAENFPYQIWPVNQTHRWIAKFGMQSFEKKLWRPVKMISKDRKIKEITNTTSEDSKDDEGVAPSRNVTPKNNARRRKRKPKSKKAEKSVAGRRGVSRAEGASNKASKAEVVLKQIPKNVPTKVPEKVPKKVPKKVSKKESRKALKKALKQIGKQAAKKTLKDKQALKASKATKPSKLKAPGKQKKRSKAKKASKAEKDQR